MAEPAPQYFLVTSDPVPLDWPEGGNRLLSLVFEELQAVDAAITGWTSGWMPSSPNDSVAHQRLTVTGGFLVSQFCLLPVKAGGLHLAIRGDGQLTPDQVLPWLDAVGGALSRLNDDEPLHKWWAVIMAATLYRAPQKLATPTHIGDFELQPADSPYVDIVPGLIPTLGGGQMTVRWPVVVAGETAGYSVPVANEAAARRLGVLCAILSVALDASWEVAQAPMEHPLDASRLPTARHPAPEPAVDGMQHDPEVVPIPDWVAQGLEYAECNSDVLSALQSHHQGMMLEPKFPSFALLAYVAAIEGIGARYVPLARCPSCPSMTGARKRFRTALELVLPKDEAKPLKVLYDLRSTTAHEGRLHAGEELFGAFPGRMVPDVAPMTFRYGYLTAMRQASRDLLLLALTGRLPAVDVDTERIGPVTTTVGD